MSATERARLTALLSVTNAEIERREREHPIGATLANPSFAALVERASYLRATLKPR